LSLYNDTGSDYLVIGCDKNTRLELYHWKRNLLIQKLKLHSSNSHGGGHVTLDLQFAVDVSGEILYLTNSQSPSLIAVYISSSNPEGFPCFHYVSQFHVNHPILYSVHTLQTVSDIRTIRTETS
jgi:hypothetical protein